MPQEEKKKNIFSDKGLEILSGLLGVGSNPNQIKVSGSSGIKQTPIPIKQKPILEENAFMGFLKNVMVDPVIRTVVDPVIRTEKRDTLTKKEAGIFKELGEIEGLVGSVEDWTDDEKKLVLNKIQEVRGKRTDAYRTKVEGFSKDQNIYGRETDILRGIDKFGGEGGISAGETFRRKTGEAFAGVNKGLGDFGKAIGGTLNTMGANAAQDLYDLTQSKNFGDYIKNAAQFQLKNNPIAMIKNVLNPAYRPEGEVAEKMYNLVQDNVGKPLDYFNERVTGWMLPDSGGKVGDGVQALKLRNQKLPEGYQHLSSVVDNPNIESLMTPNEILESGKEFTWGKTGQFVGEMLPYVVSGEALGGVVRNLGSSLLRQGARAGAGALERSLLNRGGKALTELFSEAPKGVHWGEKVLHSGKRNIAEAVLADPFIDSPIKAQMVREGLLTPEDAIKQMLPDAVTNIAASGVLGSAFDLAGQGAKYGLRRMMKSKQKPALPSKVGEDVVDLNPVEALKQQTKPTVEPEPVKPEKLSELELLKKQKEVLEIRKKSSEQKVLEQANPEEKRLLDDQLEAVESRIEQIEGGIGKVDEPVRSREVEPETKTKDLEEKIEPEDVEIEKAQSRVEQLSSERSVLQGGGLKQMFKDIKNPKQKKERLDKVVKLDAEVRDLNSRIELLKDRKSKKVLTVEEKKLANDKETRAKWEASLKKAEKELPLKESQRKAFSSNKEGLPYKNADLAYHKLKNTIRKNKDLLEYSKTIDASRDSFLKKKEDLFFEKDALLESVNLKDVPKKNWKREMKKIQTIFPDAYKQFEDIIKRDAEIDSQLKTLKEHVKALKKGEFDQVGYEKQFGGIKEDAGNTFKEKTIQRVVDLEIDDIEKTLPSKTFSGLEGNRRTNVYTPRTRRVEVENKIVPMSKILSSEDSGYKAELQSRSRSELSSKAQISDTAKRLEPELLLNNYSSTMGSPIISKEMMVESGNARILAMRQAFKYYPEKYKQYKNTLLENARLLGLTPEEELMIRSSTNKDPVVFVRERLTEMTPEERLEYLAESNLSEVKKRSEGEEAFVRSESLDITDIDAIRFQGNKILAKDGLTNTKDKFIQTFLNKLDRKEVSDFASEKGSLTNLGRERLQNAIIAKSSVRFNDELKMLDLEANQKYFPYYSGTFDGNNFNNNLKQLVYDGINEKNEVFDKIRRVSPILLDIKESVAKGDVPHRYDVSLDTFVAYDLAKRVDNASDLTRVMTQIPTGTDLRSDLFTKELLYSLKTMSSSQIEELFAKYRDLLPSSKGAEVSMFGEEVKVGATREELFLEAMEEVLLKPDITGTTKNFDGHVTMLRESVYGTIDGKVGKKASVDKDLLSLNEKIDKIRSEAFEKAKRSQEDRLKDAPDDSKLGGDTPTKSDSGLTSVDKGGLKRTAVVSEGDLKTFRKEFDSRKVEDVDSFVRNYLDGSEKDIIEFKDNYKKLSSLSVQRSGISRLLKDVAYTLQKLPKEQSLKLKAHLRSYGAKVGIEGRLAKIAGLDEAVIKKQNEFVKEKKGYWKESRSEITIEARKESVEKYVGLSPVAKELRAELDRVVQLIKKNDPNWGVEASGFTDKVGALLTRLEAVKGKFDEIKKTSFDDQMRAMYSNFVESSRLNPNEVERMHFGIVGEDSHFGVRRGKVRFEPENAVEYKKAISEIHEEFGIKDTQDAIKDFNRSKDSANLDDFRKVFSENKNVKADISLTGDKSVINSVRDLLDDQIDADVSYKMYQEAKIEGTESNKALKALEKKIKPHQKLAILTALSGGSFFHAGQASAAGRMFLEESGERVLKGDKNFIESLFGTLFEGKDRIVSWAEAGLGVLIGGLSRAKGHMWSSVCSVFSLIRGTTSATMMDIKAKMYYEPPSVQKHLREDLLKYDSFDSQVLSLRADTGQIVNNLKGKEKAKIEELLGRQLSAEELNGMYKDGSIFSYLSPELVAKIETTKSLMQARDAHLKMMIEDSKTPVKIKRDLEKLQQVNNSKVSDHMGVVGAILTSAIHAGVLKNNPMSALMTVGDVFQKTLPLTGIRSTGQGVYMASFLDMGGFRKTDIFKKYGAENLGNTYSKYLSEVKLGNGGTLENVFKRIKAFENNSLVRPFWDIFGAFCDYVQNVGLAAKIKDFERSYKKLHPNKNIDVVRDYGKAGFEDMTVKFDLEYNQFLSRTTTLGTNNLYITPIIKEAQKSAWARPIMYLMGDAVRVTTLFRDSLRDGVHSGLALLKHRGKDTATQELRKELVKTFQKSLWSVAWFAAGTTAFFGTNTLLSMPPFSTIFEILLPDEQKQKLRKENYSLNTLIRRIPWMENILPEIDLSSKALAGMIPHTVGQSRSDEVALFLKNLNSPQLEYLSKTLRLLKDVIEDPSLIKDEKAWTHLLTLSSFTAGFGQGLKTLHAYGSSEWGTKVRKLLPWDKDATVGSHVQYYPKSDGTFGTINVDAGFWSRIAPLVQTQEKRVFEDQTREILRDFSKVNITTKVKGSGRRRKTTYLYNEELPSALKARMKSVHDQIRKNVDYDIKKGYLNPSRREKEVKDRILEYDQEIMKKTFNKQTKSNYDKGKHGHLKDNPLKLIVGTKKDIKDLADHFRELPEEEQTKIAEKLRVEMKSSVNRIKNPDQKEKLHEDYNRGFKAFLEALPENSEVRRRYSNMVLKKKGRK